MARKTYTVGKGMDEYIKGLTNLTDATRGMIGMAIYDGAKIVADAIHDEIQALPPMKKKVEGKTVFGVSPAQKKGLLEGLGISTIRDDNGVRNVKIGFDGYNGVVNAKWPKGQPNVLVARWLVYGTSIAPKNDFIKRAISKCKDKAESAMKTRIDETIHNIYNAREI